MKRYVLQIFLGLLIGAVALNATTAICQDKVERRDKKTDKSILMSGRIVEEKIDGVKFRIGVKEDVIPTTEILRVYYEDVPAAAKQGNLTLFNNEEKEKDQAKILKEYQELQAKMQNPKASPAVMRYFDFRIAMLQANIADTDAQKDAAAKALVAFVGANAQSWEYPLAARALVRLQLSKPDYEAALKTLTPLATSPSVPPDIKAEADFMLIDVLFQANRLDQVKTKIDAAINAKGTTAQQKARYGLYQIGIDAQSAGANLDEIVKKLNDVIDKPENDVGVKALAFNLRGDCYFAKGRKRDAMWSYLWVDVVYTQDKNEHLKAMSRLMKIYEDEKDNDKVQFYKEKIQRIK